MTQTFNLLRGSCQHCHHFLAPAAAVSLYACRLILLERGLVAESDEMQYLTIQAARPLAKSKASKLEEQGEDTAETLSEYKARLWKYVEMAVANAKKEQGIPTRDDYKSAICFDKRKQLIAEFLKVMSARKRCGNCQA